MVAEPRRKVETPVRAVGHAVASTRRPGGTLPLILIGLGGFAGAIARYLVDTEISARLGHVFPFGTLMVNLTGSFALGLLVALGAERGILPADIRGPVLIGFLGAYTTFSTYMLESWRLIETGTIGLAAVNLFGSVALGMGALVLGLVVGRLA
jgi:CrcB protein